MKEFRKIAFSEKENMKVKTFFVSLMLQLVIKIIAKKKKKRTMN
jgi:hypothetical protein